MALPAMQNSCIIRCSRTYFYDSTYFCIVYDFFFAWALQQLGWPVILSVHPSINNQLQKCNIRSLPLLNKTVEQSNILLCHETLHSRRIFLWLQCQINSAGISWNNNKSFQHNDHNFKNCTWMICLKTVMRLFFFRCNVVAWSIFDELWHYHSSKVDHHLIECFALKLPSSLMHASQ